jgi:hypothetical protein
MVSIPETCWICGPDSRGKLDLLCPECALLAEARSAARKAQPEAEVVKKRGLPGFEVRPKDEDKA